MKKLLLFLSVVLSLSSYASISIVSDLDDTIKITNSADEINGGISAIFKNDVFTGVPEFFSAARLYTNELHILSASPKILRGKITSTLNLKKIQFESLILKEGGGSKFDYKVAELKKLFAKTSDDFIFLGDDVSQDADAYEAIRALYPNRVLAIYIHVVKGNPVPATAIKYWTSFDLFVREQIAGRMLPSWVGHSAEVTLNEKKMKFIFPDFAKCPTTADVYSWQLTTEFAREANDVTQKLLQYCLSRNSGN
jgi:hypothetical protein